MIAYITERQNPSAGKPYKAFFALPKRVNVKTIKAAVVKMRNTILLSIIFNKTSPRKQPTVSGVRPWYVRKNSGIQFEIPCSTPAIKKENDSNPVIAPFSSKLSLTFGFIDPGILVKKEISKKIRKIKMTR